MNIIGKGAYKFILYCLKKTRSNFNSNYIAIVPAAAYGGIGDDAMVRVLIRNAISEQRLPLIVGSSEVDTWDALENVKLLSMSHSKPLITLFHLLFILMKVEKLFIVGADIMDGFYDPSAVLRRIKLAKISERIGISVTITGFSFNDNPKEIVCGALKQLTSTKYSLRDEFSLFRFKKYIQGKSFLSADLAFLTKSSPENKRFSKILNWIEIQTKNKNIIVIVNLNWIPFKKCAIDADTLVDRYARILSSLSNNLSNKVSFLLLPIDFRNFSGRGDVELAENLFQKVVGEIGDRLFSAHEYTYTAEDVKSLTKGCDFLITGRMHLAIICATNAIPAFAVDYQEKFLGMYKHFGLESEGLLISSKNIFEDDVVDKIKAGIDKRDILEKRILEKLPDVIKLAHRNFGSQ